MSTDLLRRAATKIRQTAESATPGPWHALTTGRAGGDHWHVTDAGVSIAYIHASDGEDKDRRQPDAEHIALWSPDVAELVARWLEREARLLYPDGEATALARRILGEA